MNCPGWLREVGSTSWRAWWNARQKPRPAPGLRHNNPSEREVVPGHLPTPALLTATTTRNSQSPLDPAVRPVRLNGTLWSRWEGNGKLTILHFFWSWHYSLTTYYWWLKCQPNLFKTVIITPWNYRILPDGWDGIRKEVQHSEDLQSTK